MMMKKFLGATAREAMQKMKAELGPDALVISNRKTAGGVEILAMVEAPGEIAVAEAAPPRPQAAPARAAKAAAQAGPPHANVASLRPAGNLPRMHSASPRASARLARNAG